MDFGRYRFHLIGIIIGLVSFCVLATTELPEFSLIKRTVDWKDRLLSKGVPAPDFHLPTAQGKEFSLKQLTGKPFVLIFASSSCKHSNELKRKLLNIEWPNLQNHLVFVHKGKGDSRALPPEIKQLEERISKLFPVIRDTARSMFEMYKIRGVPTAYQIDKEGKIWTSSVGLPGSLELVQKLEQQILSAQQPTGT